MGTMLNKVILNKMSAIEDAIGGGVMFHEVFPDLQKAYEMGRLTYVNKQLSQILDKLASGEGRYCSEHGHWEEK